MNDLALLCCFTMFVTVGLMSPFVLSLGYVWVDALLPQALSYGLLNTIPMALITGAGAVLAYVVVDRRAPPRISSIQVMCVVLAIWITMTTTWAVAPNAAWAKWDPSFKTLIFTIFLPFVFRTRVQIEAFVMVLVFASMPHLLPWGVKTFFTGGGYGISLGLLGSNSAWIAESSAIAAIAVMFIPIMSWIRQHSLLLPWVMARTIGTAVVSALYLIATIGTFARTGLVSIGLLGIGMFLRSRRKFVFIILAAVMGSVVISATSDKWTDRVSNINEGSANTRILVWQWTWQFAKSHPLGGGFNSFLVNVISETGPDGKENVQFGRAFHNIYFSSLGEHGYPGLALYVTILVTTLLTLQTTMRRCKGHPDLLWAGDLARAVQLGIIIMMACGFFIDVSYSFTLWDWVALAMCLRAHVLQVLSPTVAARAALPGRHAPAAPPMPQFR